MEFPTKTLKPTTTSAVKIAGVLSLVLAASVCGHSQNVADDGANAKLMHFDYLHRVRYLEIFVIGGDPSKGQLYANVYNTALVPGFDGKTTRDSSPQAWVEGINVGEIKQRFNALQATLNGPKLLMPDWADFPIGAEHEFNGRKAVWCATLHLTPAMAQIGRAHV